MNFADEASHEKAYRDGLDGLFVVDGDARHVPQKIGGFPVFDMLILPVKRVVPPVPKTNVQPGARQP